MPETAEMEPTELRGAVARPTPQPLLAGGTDGNERLTVQVGAVLFVLLAVLGLTIVRIGQLLWLHLFLGLLLLGPVALKMASTGYRFARYYTSDAAYRRKGPPGVPLRVLGPLVVATTVGVFGTGVILLWRGPASRETWLLPHKVFFFIWLGVMALHVLGHLPELRHGLLGARRTRAELFAAAGVPAGPGRRRRPTLAGYEPPPRLPGSSGRALALGAALAAGLVLALVLIPDFGSWVNAQPLFHHHHHH